MLRLVNNYRLHVLEVRRFVNIRRFRTDLYQVFGFIQRSGDKEAERRFTEENRVYFEGMDEEAFDVITAITGSRELERVKDCLLYTSVSTGIFPHHLTLRGDHGGSGRP